MKTMGRLLTLLGMVLVFAGCPAAPPPSMGPPVGPNWPPYEKEAIRIHLVADSRLNLYEGSAHTLLVCVYQLRDPNGFNQLGETTEGLYKLLQCAPFDGTVTNARRLDAVQPEGERHAVIDRAEGTRYVGLVAGYYDMVRENMARLYPVPILQEAAGGFHKSVTYRAGILEKTVYVGPRSLRTVGGEP